MSIRIDEAQVRHIARLARLELTDPEVQRFTQQLGDILRYVEQLDALDTSALPAAPPHVPQENAWRPDEPRPSLLPEEALANAPQRHGDFFSVPAVLDQSGGA